MNNDFCGGSYELIIYYVGLKNDNEPIPDEPIPDEPIPDEPNDE